MARFFWEALEAGGGRPALITEHEALSYSGLVERIERSTQALRALLPAELQRPLVLLEATNDAESIVAYLACLRAGWPVALVAEGQSAASSRIASTYQPNLVVCRDGSASKASLASSAPAPMHPELAVLLSTSGTTGAAKLVRLSGGNVQANATSIAAYLQLTPNDRAITALPFHYSYGMSVLHTHLLAHAALVLTSASLVDDAFWELARRHEATSLALVPTQFELLEKVQFSERHLPTLRYITQAGGKLDARLATDFARRAKAQGWQLFIMYGQTEASPRMSYVPPEDVERWHHSIGRPVDGGQFQLIDTAGGVISGSGQPGELVYEGPNVMLGYALTRADLAEPAGPPRLKTGDIAERLENGYFRITGRTSRFIKLFGLRISLDEIEARLRAQGHRVYASGSDEKLVVFLTGGGPPEALRAQIARDYQWPERVVRVVPIESVPLLSSGKVDYAELARRAATLAVEPVDAPSNLAHLMQSALREPALDPDKSFVELGGDSLAYLEVQLFLSRRLGSVPDAWERLPLRQLYALEEAARPSTSGWQRVPADLIGRVLAILAVIALHSTHWGTGGGSVLLIILVGYSLARFQSGVLFKGQVGKTLRSMLVPIVAVYYVIVAVAALRFSPIDLGWLFLVENFHDDVTPAVLLPYWFVSTYAQIVALASLPFAVPRVRELVKRAPFEAGVVALVAVAAIIQLTAINDIFYNLRHRNPIIALELLLTGWCMFFAATTRKRWVASVAVLLVWLQNYGLIETNIAALLVGGSLCTLWGLQVSLPRPAARALLFFGSLSMFVYLAHVPALYKLSSLVEEGAPLFFTGIIVSILLALALKKSSDWVVQRFVRWGRPAPAASGSLNPGE
ncbi:MAG TPA: AMP-binding protein [Polyangiaceae bacterium]|nr:AMP-binding protein [Polyangiaceae bacterium]